MTLAQIFEKYRSRLKIANADVEVTFHLARNGSDKGLIVVQEHDGGRYVAYHATGRQQHYYANEVNYRLLDNEGGMNAMYEGIVEWLDSQNTLERAAS